MRAHAADAARTTRTCNMSHRSSVSVACFHTRVLRGCAFRGDRCRPRETSAILPARDAPDSLVFYPVAASTPFASPKGSSRDEIARPDRKGRDDDIVACAWLGVPIFLPAELARRRERQVERERERNQRSTIKAARLVCLAKAFLRPAGSYGAHRCTVPSGVFLLLSVLLLRKSFSQPRIVFQRSRSGEIY